jgi:hypothetical protein
MVRNWESWLQTAARPASATEETERDRTLERIRSAVARSPEIPASARVYVKGSYASNTNVRRDSDVDVAVEWTDWHYVATVEATTGMTPTQLGYDPVQAGPTPREFRAQVERALYAAFPVSSVNTSGDKAINVTRGQGSLDADVIPCFELHRYDAPRLDHVGHRIFPRSGGPIDNFPQQNLDNGRAKNNRTNRRYKQIVRCLKRVEGELVAEGRIAREYPGYLVECMLYNVPDHYFTSEPTLLQTLRNCLAFLWGGLREPSAYESWVEVNQLLMLFRGWSGARDPAEALRMIDAAWGRIGIS